MPSQSTTAVREKPILFSGPMIRAIIEGRKTQTRRVIKPQPERVAPHKMELGGGRRSKIMTVPAGWKWKDTYAADDGGHFTDIMVSHCPYGVGDALWVRESWCIEPCAYGDTTDLCNVLYRASGDMPRDGRPVDAWKPSIHMPRWASRLTLEITGVRVERLQAISVQDCFAEGLADPDGKIGWAPSSAPRHFAELWDQITGKKHPWADNCFVWVIEFRPCTLPPAG